MKAARAPHSFLGIDERAASAIVRTAGNPHAHVVLRGGSGGPNYDEPTTWRAPRAARGGRPERRACMVDCSHGNSGKNHERQPTVVARRSPRRSQRGIAHVLGVMLESHLVARPAGSRPGRAARLRPEHHRRVHRLRDDRCACCTSSPTCAAPHARSSAAAGRATASCRGEAPRQVDCGCFAGDTRTHCTRVGSPLRRAAGPHQPAHSVLLRKAPAIDLPLHAWSVVH